MKLQEILNESVQLSADNFPLLYKSITDRERQGLDRYLILINDSIRNGEIVNPRYQEAKQYINRVIEHAYKTAIDEPYFYNGKWEKLPPDLHDATSYTYPQIHTINGLIKKFSKFKYNHPLVKDALNFFNEVKPLTDAMLTLKDKIVKKPRAVVDKEEAEAKYRAKIASHADVQRIRNHLIEITENVYKDALKANESWLSSVGEFVIKRINEPTEKRLTLYKLFENPFSLHVAHLITKSDNFKYFIVPNYQKILKKEAKEMTDDMMQRFIEKNTNKLSEIVAKKNNLNDINILNARTNRGVVEGTMKFTFTDNAEFVVNNKVVLSRSKYNKPFYRYPTTFHNVILSDRTILIQPSEERMVELFI